jgi:hypothetical protein
MTTLELAVAAHKAAHDATGRQSKALRPGYVWGLNDWDERTVVAEGTTNECLHATRSWQADGAVLICHDCFADCT